MTEHEHMIDSITRALHASEENGINMIKVSGGAARKLLKLLKEQEVRELTRDEWRAWKNAKSRDPICMIYKQDDTRTPIWVLDPNKVHEPALLMGEIKLFTGKPTFEQCKAVKWE